MAHPRRRKVAPGWEGRTVHAIGHSTLPAEEFAARLEAHGVKVLADVRTVPKSRANPQFEKTALRRLMRRHGIHYEHIEALGGLRHPRRDSPNRAWRNRSFRGYADYMQTEAFEEGLERLRELAGRGPVAIMCAEALRWRCHRSLIADALFARGVVVQHITSRTRTVPHVPTPFARIRGTKVTYPPPPD